MKTTRKDIVRLVVFRLYNPAYGKEGNPKTLKVFLRTDNTIGYSFYGGWQSSGVGFAISNLGMTDSLPMGKRNFKNVEQLASKIHDVLKTGYGSNKVKEYEILNDLPI